MVAGVKETTIPERMDYITGNLSEDKFAQAVVNVLTNWADDEEEAGNVFKTARQFADEVYSELERLEDGADEQPHVLRRLNKVHVTDSEPEAEEVEWRVVRTTAVTQSVIVMAKSEREARIAAERGEGTLQLDGQPVYRVAEIRPLHYAESKEESDVD